MNHLWRWKAFTIPGPLLNYAGPDIGGAQFMPVPPPKNPGCPIFGVGMPYGEAAGDALRCHILTQISQTVEHYPFIVM